MQIVDIMKTIQILDSPIIEDLQYLTIYFGDSESDSENMMDLYFKSKNRAMIDIEIGNTKPYIPHLYIDGEGSGVYHNYFEDLMYKDGLVVDGVFYPFLFMEMVE